VADFGWRDYADNKTGQAGDDLISAVGMTDKLKVNQEPGHIQLANNDSSISLHAAFPCNCILSGVLPALYRVERHDGFWDACDKLLSSIYWLVSGATISERMRRQFYYHDSDFLFHVCK